MEKRNIEIIQGDSFRWVITVKNSNGDNRDLTTDTVRGYLKRSLSDVAPDAVFNVTPAAQTGDTLGQVSLTFSANETALLSSVYHYSVELESVDSDVWTLYYGKAAVSKIATQ